MQYYDKKAVGQRIRELRKNRKLTQSRMSELLDYTNERQLQRIESGETACSVDKLMEIAQILNTSTDFLLFGIEKGNNQIFADAFTGKDDNQRMYLEKILRVAAENMYLIV